MTKRTTKLNVIQIFKIKSRGASKAENLRLAQDKLYEAWETVGKKRAALAREALAISEDCADAVDFSGNAFSSHDVWRRCCICPALPQENPRCLLEI